MPSPFPGMDPYLEAPVVFPGFHNRFATHLSELIQSKLSLPYYADMTERVWVDSTRRPITPDLALIRAEVATPTGAPTPVSTPTLAQPMIVSRSGDENHEAIVEIYARGESELLVTSIEILSPSNKTPGENARDLYHKKQKEVLGSRVHLVEIDLLRGGQHTTAVSLLELQARCAEFDYHVCVSPFDQPEIFHVYAIRIQDRLPVIAIPLLPGDGFVEVDLQEAFTRSYDNGPYRARLAYTRPTPPPALTPDKAAWVQGVLQQKGLIPATG